MFDTSELRHTLIRDLQDLRSGAITVAQARARAVLARTVCETVKIEIAAATLQKQRFEPVILMPQPRQVKAA